MAKNRSYQRLPWIDRFNRPSSRQLRDSLPDPAREIFDSIHRRLLELDGVEESLSWYGASWNWTIEFRTKHSDDPLAVLIPSPEDLQLAIPFDRKFASSISVKRMKRAVRDGLELAQEPFDTRWGVWSVVSTNLMDDLQDLIQRKLRYLAKAAG
jgi:hypothetical protein